MSGITGNTRTAEDFSVVHSEAIRFIKWHNKPVWVVPNECDYKISVIRPKAGDLPVGTRAILVGAPIVNGEYTIIDQIDSLNTGLVL